MFDDLASQQAEAWAGARLIYDLSYALSSGRPYTLCSGVESSWYLDRRGAVAARMAELGIPYLALIKRRSLGVEA
ncbi:MAG: hypothetical protein ACE5KX_03770 [Acidimicrobiia bacterium]